MLGDHALPHDADAVGSVENIALDIVIASPAGLAGATAPGHVQRPRSSRDRAAEGAAMPLLQRGGHGRTYKAKATAFRTYMRVSSCPSIKAARSDRGVRVPPGRA